MIKKKIFSRRKDVLGKNRAFKIAFRIVFRIAVKRRRGKEDHEERETKREK